MTYDVENPNELLLSHQYAWCHLVTAAAPRYGGLHAVPDDALRLHREVFVERPPARAVAEELRDVLRMWGLPVTVPDVRHMDIARPPPGFAAMALPRVDPGARLAPTWLHVYSVFQLVLGGARVPTDVELLNVWLLLLGAGLTARTLAEMYTVVTEYCSASRTLEWYHRAEAARVAFSPFAYTVTATPRAAGGGTRITLRTSALETGLALHEGMVPPGFGAAHCICNALLNGLGRSIEVLLRDGTGRTAEGVARSVVARVEDGVLHVACDVHEVDAAGGPVCEEEDETRCELRFACTFFLAGV